MGRKRKEREESEEEIDYKTDMEEDIEEVEVKRRRIAKDGYVQYRCSMVAILKIVMVKKTIVSTERMKLLQSTPFGKMIAAFQNGTIEEQYVKKSDHALTLILQAYDVKTDTFTFCGKKLRISTKDVCQILGLPKGGALLPMPKKGAYHSPFIDSYFPGLHRIKKSDVEKALNRAVAKDCQGKEAVEEKDKDVMRLILLILFITVLFPNAGSSLSWDLVKHCDDLEQIGEYGWAKPVENFLRKSIHALKKGTKNEHGSHSMGGCAILILFWFCEKTKIIPPIPGRQNEELGMSKWCLKTMNQQLAEYQNLEKMKKLFKNVKEDKDDSESEEEDEEEEDGDSGEDSDSSSSSKMDDSMEDETVDIWLSQVSTQSENAAADHKEEESKKKMKKVVAKLDKVIKEEIKERPNLAAASELIEKVCKYKRLCEKKNIKFWKLILTARREFEAMKERENELPNTMKQGHRELEAELKGKEEKIQVLREEKRAWEEEKDVLMAEKASLFERVQTLEKMIAALSQDTNGQGMMEKEEEVENRKLQDENALLIEENALLSRKVKELQNFIDGNKDENREYPINNSPDRDEEEPSQCRTEVIGDYESMYTAPEDQQMLSQTIEVGDYEKDWQLVEFVGVKLPAHEDYEMGSQTVNNAANVDNGLTDCGTPKKMGWPTFDLCMGLSPAIEQPKDQHTPTVQPLAQDWESPRVLSVEILSPTLESPAPITTSDDIVLYSYVVRLKNRKRVQKKDKIYWYEKAKKKKGGEKKKKKKDKDWFVCASPITAIDEKKNLEIHYVSDDEDGEDKQMDTLDWTCHVVFNMMDTAAQKKLHEY